jgi:hypothetical protein
MSVQKFRGLIQNAELGTKDKEWFPVWLKRFAEYVG